MQSRNTIEPPPKRYFRWWANGGPVLHAYWAGTQTSHTLGTIYLGYCNLRRLVC